MTDFIPAGVIFSPTAPSAPNLGLVWRDLTAGAWKQWTGTSWITDTPPSPLSAVSTAPVSVSDTSAETELGHLTIPAGTLSPGSLIRLTAFGSIDTIANSGSVTWRLRYGGVGGTQLWSLTMSSVATVKTIQPWWLTADLICRSTGPTGLTAAGGFGRCETAPATAAYGSAGTAIDTTTTNDLTLTVQFAIIDPGNTCRAQGLDFLKLT